MTPLVGIHEMHGTALALGAAGSFAVELGHHALRFPPFARYVPCPRYVPKTMSSGRKGRQTPTETASGLIDRCTGLRILSEG